MKKFIILFLIIILSVLLFGCNRSDESYQDYDAKINNKKVPYYGFEMYGEAENLENNEYIQEIQTSYKEYTYGKNSNKLIYRDYLDGVEIIKYASMKSEAVIPEKINGKKVLKLGGYIDKEYMEADPIDFRLRSCFDTQAIVEEIYIPKTVKEIIKNTFEDVESLQSIRVDKDNPYYSSKNGILYDKTGKIKLCKPNKYKQ